MILDKHEIPFKAACSKVRLRTLLLILDILTKSSDTLTSHFGGRPVIHIPLRLPLSQRLAYGGRQTTIELNSLPRFG